MVDTAGKSAIELAATFASCTVRSKLDAGSDVPGGSGSSADGGDGDGCSCASASRPPAAGWWIGILAITFALFCRRRPSRRAKAIALVVAAMTAGCGDSSTVVGGHSEGGHSEGGASDGGAPPGGGASSAGGAGGAACEPGHVDLNGVAIDGCEYECPVEPSMNELCNGADDDCDGAVDEGNPGGGESCQEACPGGVCQGACEAGTTLCIDGALFCVGAAGPAPETCNEVDDDCDGTVDSGFNLDTDLFHCGNCATACDATDVCEDGSCVPSGCEPGFADLDQDGECEHACDVFPPVPEVCNGVDDDCDGVVDESHPTLGVACDDGLLGICAGFGQLGCDPLDPSAPAVCIIDEPGGSVAVETCNGLDDDCDGIIDNGIEAGDLASWVTMPNGREIMAYEASRQDATATDQGSLSLYACSRAGALPWTSVTQVEAAQACDAIGARLCSEIEWHQACADVAHASFPALVPAVGGLFLEAEDYAALAPATASGVLHSWVPNGGNSGFSGTTALEAAPNAGTTVTLANAQAQAPRLDYSLTLAASGNHHVWLRLNRQIAGDSSVHVGFDGAPSQTITATTTNAWHWARTPTATNLTAGARTPAVWMANDGLRVDAIYVTTSTSLTAPAITTPNGGTWSFFTSPTTYAAGVCNDESVDNPLIPGNQDELRPSGSLPNCRVGWAPSGDVYDLSGNAKEWTLERYPGTAIVRGGSYSSPSIGARCASAVELGTAETQPSIGFRCCR